MYKNSFILISVLIYFLTIMTSSCTTLPEATSTNSLVTVPVQQTFVYHSLENEKIGYLDFMPLPPNYSSDYFPNERVFTGEVYSKDPTASLSSILSNGYLFVPKDYQTILESSFYHTLISMNLKLKKYKSLQEARFDREE
ncbi:MAG: hypothetical protein SCARUB_00785 [Candidatus Scalindua rubra]|uniref:Lipoprotein n=1 Tax=Candidatus Scalindua rubra TaxID=1872076 RepID=A0A1E3XEQ4_9BACT|nr:MAG: hypothetical protein SCARUB_00785 [Candidatus Scalindua rubra]